MGGDIKVKGSDTVEHTITSDTIGTNQTQVVKVQMGGAGEDGGFVNKNNPLPIEMAGFFKRLFLVFGRFSFDTTSALRTSGAVTVSSGTVTTVGTMTTGNIGFGDSGKASTIMQISQQSFMGGIRRNFSRT